MIKELLSTSGVAKISGISRIAVFKKIKAGEIEARKVGRNFVIERGDLPQVSDSILREDKKKEVEEAVKRTVAEYGEALKLLGKE